MGSKVKFLGAFAAKADAEKVKNQGKGRKVRRIKVQGKPRYVVMEPR